MYRSPRPRAIWRGEMASGSPPGAVERLRTPRVWVTRQRWRPAPRCRPPQRPKLWSSAECAPHAVVEDLEVVDAVRIGHPVEDAVVGREEGIVWLPAGRGGP